MFVCCTLACPYFPISETASFFFKTKWLVPEGHESNFKPVGEVQHCSELSMNSAVVQCPSGLSRFDYAAHASLYYGIGGMLRRPESSCFPSQSIHFILDLGRVKNRNSQASLFKVTGWDLLVTKEIMTNKLRKHIFLFLSLYLFWSMISHLFLQFKKNKKIQYRYATSLNNTCNV